MTDLCDIARKYGTDKGGNHTIAGSVCHNYTPIYHSLLADKRRSVLRVLEVGINTGASLRMWRDYFSYATIYGIDIDPACLIREERIISTQADQTDRSSMLAALDHFGQYKGHRGRSSIVFDLIVDDGNHSPEAQIAAYNTLLPYLAPDGVYAIEDGEDLVRVSPTADAGIPLGYCMVIEPAPGAIGRPNDVLIIMRKA